MQYYELDKEEQELLDSVDNDEWKSVFNKDEKKRLAAYAASSLNRKRNVNIRLSERDLQKLKAKAAEKGIPYQTLLASVLHQYSSSK